MTTIWLVFTGDCSDRNEVGAYSTKEKAEYVAAYLDGDVVEMELDSYSVLDYTDLLWSVPKSMTREGMRARAYRRRNDRAGSFADKINRVHLTRDCQLNRIDSTVWALTEEAAIEKLNELEARFYAGEIEACFNYGWGEGQPVYNRYCKWENGKAVESRRTVRRYDESTEEWHDVDVPRNEWRDS